MFALVQYMSLQGFDVDAPLALPPGLQFFFGEFRVFSECHEYEGNIAFYSLRSDSEWKAIPLNIYL